MHAEELKSSLCDPFHEIDLPDSSGLDIFNLSQISACITSHAYTIMNSL
jgi:hypothetical protein